MNTSRVMKRNGQVVDFDKDKIEIIWDTEVTEILADDSRFTSQA